jgi:hypothetical protein
VGEGREREFKIALPFIPLPSREGNSEALTRLRYSKKAKEVKKMPAKKKASYKCVKCGYKSSKPGKCCGTTMKKMAK